MNEHELEGDVYHQGSDIKLKDFTTTKNNIDVVAELMAIAKKKKEEIEVVRLKYSSLFCKKVENLKGKRVRITKYNRRFGKKEAVWMEEGTVIGVMLDINTDYFSGYFVIHLTDYCKEVNIHKNTRLSDRSDIPFVRVDIGDKVEILE